MRLCVRRVRVEIGGVSIVDGVSLEVSPGELVGVIGPNGSGKSTLLRAVYRHLRPAAGAVYVGGDDVWRLSPRCAARRTAAVPQETRTEFDVTVRELVAMGRTPYKKPFAPDEREDRAAVEEALRLIGCVELAERRFASLSGGEKQRVLIARALAQRSRVLVLDEPTNHLDIGHQLELLELVRGLGLATLAAMHDLNLAAAYCDRLYVLAAGRVVAEGPPGRVLQPELLREVFGVAAEVMARPGSRRPYLVFSPLRRCEERGEV